MLYYSQEQQRLGIHTNLIAWRVVDLGSYLWKVDEVHGNC